MNVEYVHQKLDEEIRALAGYYVPMKEVRLKYDGHEVLYTVGSCTIESSCCGGNTGCMGYVIVPGYLVAWKSKTNEGGLPVSEVTKISDEKAREEIAKIIRDTENVRNVDFW